MQELWATISTHHHSLCFKLNGRSHTLNVENFRDMLHICLRLHGQRFEYPPLEEEILSFIRDLDHTGEIKVLTDVNVNYMHQPWRSFAAIINKFLSEKTTGLDSLHLSRAQILWGMYHKKNVDYVYLLWEDMVYQVENKNSKNNNDIDDPMFNTIRVISRHQDSQVYGPILPAELTNQDMLDSKAYKEYYAVASGAEPPKAKTKYKKKADGSVTSPKSKTASASKCTRIKSKVKVTKPALKKQPTKNTKAKGLAILSEVALSEAAQVKLVTKRSKTDFHNSQACGSRDGVDTQSKVPDEQQQKTFGTDEGTGTIPWVPDSDSEEIPNPNLTKEDQTEYEEEGVDEGVRTPFENEFTDEEKLDDEETMDDEEDDDVLKELYEDVNVNFEKGDAEMTDANPKEMSELKQTNQFVEAVLSIPAIVDQYLASEMKEAVDVDVQLQTNKLREEAQAENQDFLNQVDSTMQKIIKNQVKEQVSKIMPNIEKYVIESLRAEILIDKMEANKSIDGSNNQKNLYKALVDSYNSDKDILSSYGEVVLLKRGRDDQDKDEDPSVGSDRGTKRRKSGKDAASSKDSRSMEKKSSSTSKDASQSQHKSSAERLDWHNPENKLYPFDLRKPLSLIQDHRGRQIIPKDYFIKGGDSSRRYSTSVTKTTVATYELKWIEDLVPKLWSPMVMFTPEEESLQLPDLKSRRCMTTVTWRRLKRKRLMRIDELHKFSDGTLNGVRSALHDIVARIRMEYLPIRKWGNLDKKRARVMVQEIDKQLYQRRLMRNLENFVGRRPYGQDLQLPEPEGSTHGYPLDSVEVLKYDTKGENLAISTALTELTTNTRFSSTFTTTITAATMKLIILLLHPLPNPASSRTDSVNPEGLGLDLDRPYSFVIIYYTSQRSKEDDVQKISTSVFVTNFPGGYGANDLWNTCKLYGHVVDVFIPDRRTKAGKRFGFVHFIKIIQAHKDFVIDERVIWVEVEGVPFISGSQRSKEDDVQNISTSVFVTNFSDGYGAKDLWKTCKLYGHVVDVFIPDRRTKADGVCVGQHVHKRVEVSNDTHESTCYGYFKKSEVPRKGGSILELIDDLVNVGKT
nr:nucleotide-binding alpha-beta plait domain-containing protein [Tanacetum cinerariifolium]